MPHVTIKLIKGASPEKLKEAAAQISDIMEKTLGKPKKYTSVSAEEFSFDEWAGVYDECIKGRDLLVQPGYSNPKTFE